MFCVFIIECYFSHKYSFIMCQKLICRQTSALTLQQQQQQQWPFNGLWSGTTRVGRYQKELSPTHTHPDHRASFIIFLHLQRSMASSLFNLRAWQSSRTTSFQVFFGLPLGLEPSTSYSMHFFTQSSSSFHSKCPYQLWRCLSYRGSAGGYLLIECRGVAALQVRSSQ